MLREVGLVHVDETRQVCGGADPCYQCAVRQVVAAAPRAPGTPMLAAVAHELDRTAVEAHLTPATCV